MGRFPLPLKYAYGAGVQMECDGVSIERCVDKAMGS